LSAENNKNPFYKNEQLGASFAVCFKIPQNGSMEQKSYKNEGKCVQSSSTNVKKINKSIMGCE
jgi:hypothetical protein